MDVQTARELARLTGDFYARTCDSFAVTRERGWEGWRRVVAESGLLVSANATPRTLEVLDLACGNQRFARYLGEELAGVREAPLVRVHAFDSCDELARLGRTGSVDVRYAHLDITGALFEGGDLARLIGVGGCDLCVCFGFMHHLALREHRVRVLEALVDCTRPGGMVAVSFWQLSHSARLLAKAQALTEAAAPGLGLAGLGRGDYLLGWQDRTDVVRYCHDFCEAELDDLAAAVAPRASEVARFSADGASGNLNRYLLLCRNG